MEKWGERWEIISTGQKRRRECKSDIAGTREVIYELKNMKEGKVAGLVDIVVEILILNAVSVTVMGLLLMIFNRFKEMGLVPED